jgi:hypothetical protein
LGLQQLGCGQNCIHAPGGGRISRPIFFAISIPRGMGFADGHHCANLGLDVSTPLK